MDVDEVVPVHAKKGGKSKSPAKSAPTTNKWTAADLDAACQNRYTLDLSEMIKYRQNYLSATDKTTFNLKNHSKYLDIILSQPGIAQDVVFTRSAGHQYFLECKISPALYDQGLLNPVPKSSSSQQFPEKEVVGIRRIMVVVACPNGQNITDDDPDGFGRTCMMGLWGIHTEKVLHHCHKTCADRVNEVLACFCPFCEFWTTNNVALHNHMCKHYGMVMSCYHDGYTTGSMVNMKQHMCIVHKILMESAHKKRKRTK